MRSSRGAKMSYPVVGIWLIRRGFKGCNLKPRKSLEEDVSNLIGVLSGGWGGKGAERSPPFLRVHFYSA